MLGRPARSIRIALTVATAFLAIAVGWGQGQEPSRGQAKDRSKKKVDPDINAPFRKADVKDFLKRFESEDREVYARRREIVKALDLKPGMAVADVGAGTGLFTRLIAEAVGPGGKVYAVDISDEFLRYIADQAKKRGQPQIATVHGAQDSTHLAPNSVDAAFLCDVYHHFEKHESMLASIRQALRPGGVLYLIEFDRVEGKSSDFVKKHIRASQAEFRGEVERAGFEPVTDFRGPRLRENFFAKFRKADEKGRSRPLP
jgi:ubiquinone/menaquinone biosynthesis C-methylase UbiE